MMTTRTTARGVPCRAGDESPSGAGHITVAVENPDVFHEPEGDPRKVQRASATVAHSFSLMMARELRCADDGGLKPARRRCSAGAPVRRVRR
ncbi:MULTISPECIES: hypothetical protein [unclassified Streptomyces]|uniref:hypothetical protein n=1 Tax=unclassified Streptomyces TaxID=2593676 RepID=UPI0033A0B695